MDAAKADVGINALRGDPANPPLPRELELLELCNQLVHGQVPDAFPGSQPTSLNYQKVEERLLKAPYVVCEKTDGERHLLFGYQGRVYLIDRRNRFWLCPVQLPLRSEHPRSPGWHHNTLLDGELVIDEDSQTGTRWLRYLVYDAMAICGEDVTHRTLLHRLRRALSDVIWPKEQLLRLGASKESQPLQLLLKDFFEIWQLRNVMTIAAGLPHNTDGLVFTPVNVPYAAGTCSALLKWKPACENTVDFKLQVVIGDGKNMHVRLLVGWKAGKEYQVKFTGYWLAKTGEAFKRLKEDPNFYDDKIGECKWQATAKTFTPADHSRFTLNGCWEHGGWVLQRLREDKKEPNDLRTAKRVVESIQDDLGAEDLEKMLLDAHAAGSVKAAASCGEGHLPRAEPTPGSVSWVRPASASGPRPAPLQLQSDVRAEKDGKATGKGKRENSAGKGLITEESDVVGEQEFQAPKGKDRGEKGKGKGKAKSSGKGNSKGAQKRKNPDEDLMRWSAAFTGETFEGLERPKETSAESRQPPEDAEQIVAAKVRPRTAKEAPTASERPADRPRTVADLKARAAADPPASRPRTAADLPASRPRTAADLSAAKRPPPEAEVAPSEEVEVVRQPASMGFQHGGLKRQRRAPTGLNMSDAARPLLESIRQQQGARSSRPRTAADLVEMADQPVPDGKDQRIKELQAELARLKDAEEPAPPSTHMSILGYVPPSIVPAARKKR